MLFATLLTLAAPYDHAAATYEAYLSGGYCRAAVDAGNRYASGLGVERDLKEASHWFGMTRNLSTPDHEDATESDCGVSPGIFCGNLPFDLSLLAVGLAAWNLRR